MSSDYSQKSNPFTGPKQVHEFDAILFDMDGTIIDSTQAVIRAWTEIGKEIGVDPDVILATSHGRRSIEVLREHDPSKANWEYVSKMETQIPLLYGSSATEIPGARTAISSIPPNRWAIVTSGSRGLVGGWLKVLSLPAPEIMVTAEDVTDGKPAPDCYLKGRSLLGFKDDAKILVVEDAPAGIKSGKRAGCKVIGLCTSHKREEVEKTEADWVIQDMRSCKVLGYDETKQTISVEISEYVESRGQ